MNARTIKATLEAWDATGHLPTCTREAMAAESMLCETVKSSLLAIDGIDGVTFECGSAGSIYFECYSDASDDQNISIKVRVSNHKAGRRANELAADFVVGDSVEEIERQLAKVAEAIAAEIDFVLNKGDAMFRVTRKQKIVQGGNVIEFEDFADYENMNDALIVQRGFLFGEIAIGYQPYGPNKVIFESPSFYRSVTVTIEEIQ